MKKTAKTIITAITKAALLGKEVAIETLFPRECAFCKKEGVYACGTCLEEAVKNSAFYCPHCKKRIPPSAEPRCSDYCLSQTGIRAVYSLLPYSCREMRSLLHQFKFGNVREIGEILGALLAQKLARAEIAVSDSWIVVPVPLHPKKLRQRGFNQSEILARHVAQTFFAPFASDILSRTKNTAPQSKTEDKDERAENVREAFTATHCEKIKGKNILLVDDICTTGATLKACAQCLKSAGAKKIYAATVAR